MDTDSGETARLTTAATQPLGKLIKAALRRAPSLLTSKRSHSTGMAAIAGQEQALRPVKQVVQGQKMMEGDDRHAGLAAVLAPHMSAVCHLCSLHLVALLAVHKSRHHTAWKRWPC